MLNIKDCNDIQRQLPYVVNNIQDLRDLFNSEQKEFDLLDETIDYIIKSAFLNDLIQLKESGYDIEKTLEKWEFIYGIKSNKNQTEEDRVALILAKLKMQQTTTEQVILDICKSFKKEVYFEEDYKNYSFILGLALSGKPINSSMLRTIDKSKPAHLNYKIRGFYKHNYYIGTTFNSAERIRVYPYNNLNINFTNKYYIGASIKYTCDTTKIYPKEVI